MGDYRVFGNEILGAVHDKSDVFGPPLDDVCEVDSKLPTFPV